MIIYKISNLINNKVYIGQTIKTIEYRWKHHCKLNNKRSCRFLLNAIRKHGKENFKIEEIEKCENKEELNIREKYWISFYKSFGEGYNLTSGGNFNVELSLESRKMISKKLKGKSNGRKGIPTGHTPWNKGKKFSPEVIEKMRHSRFAYIYKINPNYIKKEKIIKIGPFKRKLLSDETKLKMSLAKKGKPNKSNTKFIKGQGALKVKNIETGEIFSSFGEASIKYNIDPSNISKCIHGHIKTAAGFHWELVKE